MQGRRKPAFLFMPDNILQIGAQVALDQLKAGMSAMVSTVKSSVGTVNSDLASLSTGQETVAQATQRLNVAFSGLKTTSQTVAQQLLLLNSSAVQMSSNTETARALIAELEGELAKVAPAARTAGAEVENMGQRATRSLTDARLAAMLLGRELGVPMPRALSGIAARSETLGPIFNSAFSVIAAIGFIEILGQVLSKINDVAEAYMGWDEAAKKTYADVVAGNQRAMRAADEMYAKQLQLNTIGLEGSQKEFKTAKDLAAEKKRLGDELIDQLRKEQDLQQQIQNSLSKPAEIATRVAGAEAMPEGFTAQDFYPTTHSAQQLQEELTNVQKRSQELKEKLDELNKVTLPRTLAEGGVESLKEAQEAAKKFSETMLLVAKQVVGDQSVIAKEIQKQDQESRRSRDELLKSQLKADQQEADSHLQTLMHEAEATVTMAEAEDKVKQDQLKQQQAWYDEAFKLGTISATDHIRLEKQTEDQIYALKLDALQQRLALKQLDPDANPAELARIQAQILELKQEHENAITQIEVKGEQDRVKAAQDALRQKQQMEQQMVSFMDQEWNRMLFTAKSTTQAMQMLWQDLAKKGIDMVVHMVDQQVVSMLVGEQEKTLNAEVGESERSAIQTEAGLKHIFIEAKKAAAGAWNAFVDIPVVGPELAAVASAATFAAVMALAAFHEGGVANDEMLAVLKQGEMVLPPDISKNVQKNLPNGVASGIEALMTAGAENAPRGGSRGSFSGTGNSDAAGRGAFSNAPNAGGDVHLHVTAQVLDGADLYRYLKNNQTALAAAVRGLFRNGRINPRNIGIG